MAMKAHGCGLPTIKAMAIVFGGLSRCTMDELSSSGRYDPVLEDVESGFESIDQGALDRTSQPTEVFLEVPRFLETSNIAERNFETTPVPFTTPSKEFRPFSRECFNGNLNADFSHIPNPYNVFNDQTDTKFKLPISEEYDPEGTKIDGRLVEERILRKIREHSTKSKKGENITNINKVKPKVKEKRKSVTFKEDDVINIKKRNSIETIQSTANSLVDESLERAVTVAEEIIKEMDTELNSKMEFLKKTEKNAPTRIETVNRLKEELNSTIEDETCDVPKSVKESIQFYESIDSQLDAITKKEEKVEDERKLFLIQEIEESIEAGSVRRKSDIFSKDTVMTAPSNNVKNQKINTLKYQHALRSFNIGSQTIRRLKSVAEKSLPSKSLFKKFFLYLSNVFISLTKSFSTTKYAKCNFDTDKTSKSYYNKSENIEVHTNERNVSNEKNILRRRKLSGAEMAQLSLKKPKELTQKMDTVISEFHSKINITDIHNTMTKSETSKVSTNFDSCTGNLINSTHDIDKQRGSHTFNSLEWVAKMSNEEREQVKKDIKLATLAAARRVAERRRTGESHSYENSKNLEEFDIEPMDVATYIAIVESHVYTNKDAIFDDYVSNLNKNSFTTEKRNHNILESEYIMAKSYKLSDHYERKTDESMLKRTGLSEDKMLTGTSVSGETRMQGSALNTEYVATVTVEHKPAPFISTVATHETRFDVHKDESEQKIIKVTTDQTCTVNEVKDKQIIIEAKDDIAMKTNLEKIVPIETTPAVTQNIEEDQVESLTITDITEEAPIVILESELNTAQVMGKETLRQISADFRDVELLQQENFNIIENKPDVIMEDKKLAEAYIINKAIIEEISLVFDEITTEPMTIITPKEESAVTSTEIQELARVKPVLNATVTNFDIIFLEPESVATYLNYETKQIMPSIDDNEIIKVNAHCTASVYFVILENEEIKDMTIEPVDEQLANACVESETLLVAIAIHTALSGQIEIDMFETDSLDDKPIKDEKVNNIEETKEFFKAFSYCIAFCQSVEYISEECEMFNVDGVKEEYITSSLEPSVFSFAVCLRTSLITQISTDYNDGFIAADNIQGQTAQALVESDKLFTVRPICMVLGETADTPLEKCNLFEVKSINKELFSEKIEPEKLSIIRPICTPLGETTEILFEESKWFDIDVIKDVTCSLIYEPDRLSITLPIATHAYGIININYIETGDIIIKTFKEKLAHQSEEINKFFTAQGICTGECKTINFEESNLFEVAEIKYRKPLERLEPIVYKTTLPFNTATAQAFNMVYDEVAILEPHIFNKQVALIKTEVKNFVRILALCQAAEEQSILLFKEPELLSLSYKVKEQFANVTTESKRFTSALNINTPIANEFILHYEKTENFDSSITTEAYVKTSLYVPKLKTCLAIGEAVVEDLHVKIYSVENIQKQNFLSEKQIATSAVVPDVFKVALTTINRVVQATSTFKENVAIQESNISAMIEEQTITLSDSQQLAKAPIIREAPLHDDRISVKATYSENIEKTEYDHSHLNTIQEAGHIKSFDTVVKQAVIVKEQESEQKLTKKVIKRKTDKVHVEEAASNISILKKSEIKEADSYKETSYKISKLKNGEEITSESTQQTLYLNKNIHLQKSQLKEEYQTELLDIKQDLEEDSQVIIKDVTDVDETSDESCAIQIVQEAKDIDSRRSSRELRLQSVEVEEISENVEDVAFINDFTKLEKAKAAVDESAALTVVKQEEIEIACPVLEVYEIEEELTTDMEGIAAESAITSSTKLNEQKVNIKENDQQLTTRTQKSAVKMLKGADTKKKAKSIKTHETIRVGTVDSAVSEEFESMELLNSEDSNKMALTMGSKHKYVQEHIEGSAVSQRHKSESLLTSAQSNKIDLQMGMKHEYFHENIAASTVSQEFKSEELITSKSSSEQALKMGSREQVQGTVAKSIEATRARNAKELTSEELQKKKLRKVAIKTGSKHERDEEEIIKSIESSAEVQSPIPPPTPLIDEYIFRLVAPLPKSRSTTPIPRDPEPEPSESSTTDDPRVAKKNLIPVVDCEISERVRYNPPITSPPTSPGHTPVYTKPGLNGGMKLLPRYIKPGLRGGSDRPLITKEEILEVRRKSSILASAITETLKNIEKYKKEVGILKQGANTESQSEFDMETDETISNVKEDKEIDKIQSVKENQDAESKKLDNKNKEVAGEKQETTSDTPENDENNVASDRHVKEDVKATNVDEKYDNFSEAFEEVTLVEDIVANKKRDHSETIEECFDVIENEGQITEGVVEFPTEIVDKVKIQNPVVKELTPESLDGINVEEHEDKSETKAAKEMHRTPGEVPKIVEETVDVQLDAAADEEVARVTALTPDPESSPSKGRSPALSPREAELMKEAHVISLTRVLSAHMIRESLSPDPQRIESIKNKEVVTEDKRDAAEGEKDRTWTSFLQKSTRPGPGQNLKHFADLQNKFEPKESLIEKTDLRISSENNLKNFNSSPVPWQERALADSLGAPSVLKLEEPVLTPEDPPEFLIAIPPQSVPGSDQRMSSKPSTQDVPRIEIQHTIEAEDRSAVKVSVDKIVEEALRVAENLEIGDEKNRLMQLLSTNIKNITDSNFLVEDQLSKMRSQIQTLAQVPEIISKALENLSEQLSVISQRRKEETVVQKREATTQPSQATIQERNQVSKQEPQEVIPPPQSKKEVDQKVEKMPAETRGIVTVTEATDKISPKTAKEKVMAWPWGPSVVRKYRINFMKYEKPPIPLDHLQRSEVYKLVHDVDQAPPKRVETLRPAIAEADYRERCRSLSPCPPDSSKEQNPSNQFQP